MRTRQATAFETDYQQSEKGLKARRVLKSKSKAFGGGGGQNIRPAIPGGVTMTTINPTDNPKAWAKAENREAWKAKRTWMGAEQGWVLLEDDSEDSVVHPTNCDCCETDQDALDLLFSEDESPKGDEEE